ncbi:MAG TPA: uroporphyrinogen-III synthase [Devosia sp.]|jgi:uroporphyrinogen-III synthase|nr:uroporphyrinogen-III synthase [Devosia sp.]
MVRLLVTRPEPDASETAARLGALGIETEIEPLLVAQTLTTTLPAPDGFAALAVTSANALRALRERGDIARLQTLPVYAVGDGTAAFAGELGFPQVVSAAGNVRDLVALLAQAGVDGPVLYPTARQYAGDLAKALAPHGVMVITAAVYEMNPAPALRADLSRLDGALFYSPRTARTFAALAPPDGDRTRLGMLCLSEAVAAPLLAAHFVRVGLADHPSEEAMMALALSFARDQKLGMISPQRT